jgi:hypothetical protein
MFVKLINSSLCVGLIPQPRSPTKCLRIEKSIKEGQGPQIRTVEVSWKKKSSLTVSSAQIIWLTSGVHIMMNGEEFERK